MRLLGQFDRPFTQFHLSYYFSSFVQAFYKKKKPPEGGSNPHEI